MSDGLRPTSEQKIGAISRKPRVVALDGRDLIWLIGEFLDACRARIANKPTIAGYRLKLKWFCDWWETVGPQQQWLLHQIDLVAFERYLRTAISKLTERTLSWNTRSDILGRLRECLGWAFRQAYTDKNYSAWVPAAYGSPPKRVAASITHLSRLLEEAERWPDATCNRCILAIFIGMGLRKSELVHLNVEHIFLRGDGSGHAHVKGKRTRANNSGERDAAFDEATGAIIYAYLKTCNYKSGPLFRNPTNQRLSDQGVYRRVKKLIERAGLEDKIVGPHDLRRAFATHTARSGKQGPGADDRLRRQLGHASFVQTAEYTLLDVDDIRRNMTSPLTMATAK